MNDNDIFSDGVIPSPNDSDKSDESIAPHLEEKPQQAVASDDSADEGYKAPVFASERQIPPAPPMPPVPENIQLDSSNIEEFLDSVAPPASAGNGAHIETPTAQSAYVPVGTYTAQPRQGIASEPPQQPPMYNPYAGPQHQPTQQPPFQYTPPMQNNYTHPSAPAPQPKKSRGGKLIAFALIALCLIVGVFFVLGGLDTGKTPQSETTQMQQTTAEKAPEVSVNSQPSVSAPQLEKVNSVWVAEKVRPGVVGVMTYIDGQLAGEGSGVIWAEDRSGEYTYVVTCAHVIDEKKATFGILLLDGRRFEAEMVAADVRTDIGVLKVKATGLPAVELGDSSALKIGEPIYAIGNPGGSEFFGSFTDGVVSGIDRSISATYTMTCVQHSAAINPGNSGGALVNTSGQVVGINSSKIARTDYEGMGFAVPMSIVKPVVDALIEYRYVPNRPKLGIEYADVSTYQLYSMIVSIKGLPQGSLVIAGISSDSSLAGTEAEVGDLIIGVNGKAMDDSSVLLDLIDTGAVGDTLTLTLCRIEKRTYKTTTFDVTITLVEDKGNSMSEIEETTAATEGDYYYGGAGSFEDFFSDYFGFGW